MSERDRQKAATKYAGKESASDRAKRKEGASGGDVRAAMRRMTIEPRSEESKGRAQRHKAGLPRLG